MAVLTASTEKSVKDVRLRSPSSDTESISSSEESRLIPKEKKEERTEEKHPYPKSIFFIVGNEFCERFTYYGLRAVLTIYMTQRLYYSEDSATAIFHGFAMLAYFTPIFGAIIADSWLGKFNTILILSIFYCIGTIVLSFGAFPAELTTMTITSIVGLIIIGCGTGGIKPCVSAFGGDQFKEGQDEQLRLFFSIFYLTINLGSTISQFVTPVLREDVHCLGENTCYPLAFGVPAILMIVAVIIFVVAKPLYIMKPPEGNIVVKVSKCVSYALCKKMKSSEKKRSHWLDYADDQYDKELISDIKTLFHVLVLYIPLPLFWCLFEQQGSRWTLQATRMNGDLGFYHMKADQVQVFNPIFIITFIPLFEYVIYPLLHKCHLLTKPLQKMTAGGLLAAVAFIVAGFVELNLETSYAHIPDDGFTQVNIINNSPCSIKLQGLEEKYAGKSDIKAFGAEMYDNLPMFENYTWDVIPDNCNASKEPTPINFNAEFDIMAVMITVQNNKLTFVEGNSSKNKSSKGDPRIRVFYSFDASKGNTSFKFVNEKDPEFTYVITTEGKNELYGMSNYSDFEPGSYKMYLTYNATHFDEKEVLTLNKLGSGGIYLVEVYHHPSENLEKYEIIGFVKENSVSILLQIPQYAIITAGEVMFSITGLEFSYNQAPTSMKSVIQALWLLTSAVGNLIMLIIAEAQIFKKPSNEFFFFGVLMAVDMLVFAILAYFYKYVDYKTRSKEKQMPPRKGESNEGYEEETDFNK